MIARKLESIIRHAHEFHDGHFFILGFTTHYKGAYSTPDLDTGDGRAEVRNLPAFTDFEKLLDHMLTAPCGCIRLTRDNDELCAN